MTSSPAPQSRPSEPTRRTVIAVCVCVLVTFANFAVWSLATPLFASPDEPTQVIHAAAAARGQLVGATVDGPRSAYTGVTVPAVFASGANASTCFAFHADVSASCAQPLTASAQTVRVDTYVGRYPPLYYVVVGLPSLLFVSKAGIYLMRLMSSLLNALLISLALLAVIVWSSRKLLLVGVTVAATPMAWFLGGMVNPSGFEICAAIALWTSGLVLVLEHPDRPPPGLVAIVAVAVGLLSLARPISPLWVAMTLAVLALLGGRRAVVGLYHSRTARWSIPPLVACAAFALWWIEAEHALNLLPISPAKRNVSDLEVLETVAGRTWPWTEQMIGVFGWLDTKSPVLTYAMWLGIVGVLVGLAVWRAGAWRGGTLLGLLAAVVVVPIGLTYLEARRLGINGQGRYWLPLAVGIPLVAVALLERAPMSPRHRFWAALALSIGLWAASSAAFLEALRRYAVGVTGPLDFLAGRWRPPDGLAGAAISGCACMAVLLVLVLIEARSRLHAPGVRPASARPVLATPSRSRSPRARPGRSRHR